MGGVWGREDETEDEETAGEEEEGEEEEREEKEEDEEKEGEKIWGGNESLALGRKEEEEEEEEGSFEDEEVNRALVVNIKEKINKLEETVRLG